MKTIHCLNEISPLGTALLTEEYTLTNDIKEAQGVLLRSASMHEMEMPEGLLAIARAGAGVNNIPLDACAAEGIVVFNTPGANANGVKELVIAGLLLASRDITGGIEWCKANVDDVDIAKSAEKAKKAFAGCEIKGKKLGVIGLGAIGAEVANACSSLGMEVYGYDPFLSVNSAWGLSRNIRHITSLDTIYKECDYITVHVPLFDTTKGMINKAAFDTMKDGSVILNFARDILVNEEDMKEALKSGKVKKYVTDFPNATSAHLEGAMVIPHLGASTEESEDNCAKMAVEEIMDYIDNGNIRNSVNFPACDMGICKTESRIAVLHLNIPNMIGQITGTLAAGDVNITDMTNKSREKYAYTLIDLEKASDAMSIQKLNAIKGVLRVRVIK
jgi:D-3-phosphoglycerate dehydrogenase